MGSSLAGYWSPAEIAKKINRSPRWVLYKITGRGSVPPELKAIRQGHYFFVEESEALQFIKRYQQQEQ